MKKILTIISLIVFSGQLFSQPLQRVKPEEVGMDAQKLEKADDVIYRYVRNGTIPGAVFAVVRHGKIAYMKAYGYRSLVPFREPMTENTIFDLASLTKPLATAISAMILVERGELDLYAPVNKYIPEFKDWTYRTGRIKPIKIINLLTHTSGLPAYAPYERLTMTLGSPNPQGFMRYISNVNRQFPPETDFEYSCLNFITLQNVIQNITHKDLRDFAKENIYDVLGMKNTDFVPSGAMLKNIAPTEKTEEYGLLKGVVQDPLARLLNGGISGNAGLFSNAGDIAILVAALQNGGSWNNQDILKPETVKMMRSIPMNLQFFGRALGWDISSVYSNIKGSYFGKNTYMHTGYTGTSVVIDPDTDTGVIILTNRVHPKDKGNIKYLRIDVANIVAGAIVK